jgi:hypothetical protein
MDEDSITIPIPKIQTPARKHSAVTKSLFTIPPMIINRHPPTIRPIPSEIVITRLPLEEST